VSRLAEIIQECTDGVHAVDIDYSDRFPRAHEIAARCSIAEVKEILRQIEVLAVEREDADRKGQANGDDLDFYWSRMARYASLLPHLVPKYPNELLVGLSSERDEVRLFVAHALVTRPSHLAVHPLEGALEVEKPGPVSDLLSQALSKCRSRAFWRRISPWR